MKKSVRILSLIGALVLIGLVVASLVFSFLDVPWAGSAAISCIFAALALSILFFAAQKVAQHLSRKKD